MKRKIFSGSQLLLVGLMILGVLLRVLWLDQSARFTRDESSDLVRMHQYYRDKKITLVGPISADNTKVFSSLTYYLLMPFAVIGNFDPISPVWGMAFYGIITLGILVWLVYRLTLPTSIRWLGLILLVVWTPLLESSRWAWNPHLVPLWMALALGLWRSRWRLKWIGIGLGVGLAFHQHYLALAAGAGFIIAVGLTQIGAKRIQSWLLMGLGLAIALLPFVVFDLRHPPGLFFTTYLRGGSTPHVEASFSNWGVKLYEVLEVAGQTVVRLPLLAWVCVGLLGWLWLDDRRHKRGYGLWFIPVLLQMLVGLGLSDFQFRYFLPAVVFLFYWLMQPRKSFGGLLQRTILLVMIGASLVVLPKQLTETTIPPDIRTVRSVAAIVKNVIQREEPKNPNITATLSPDLDMLSMKYRDLLSIDGIQFRAASEYDASEHLFVISTAGEVAVRENNSFPLLIFGDERLREVFEVGYDDYKVYWFSY